MQWVRQRTESKFGQGVPEDVSEMKLTGQKLVLNRPEAAGGLFCQVLGYEFDRHPEWKRSDCLEDRTEMDAGGLTAVCGSIDRFV